MAEIIVPMNIKRCAHCGGYASIEMVSSQYRVRCNQCGASTQLCRTPDEALCKWNRRYESIVHCKDCKHFVNPLDYDLKPYCNSPHEGYAIPPNTSKRVKPDGFCAWGERRE